MPITRGKSRHSGGECHQWTAKESERGQDNHDLWHAKQHVKLGKGGKVRLTAA
ncbi:MAG: hypothetical protein P0121_04470 [Nitrospira sp.]|nr:hypothetical protein [Nitrospira sp.]